MTDCVVLLSAAGSLLALAWLLACAAVCLADAVCFPHRGPRPAGPFRPRFVRALVGLAVGTAVAAAGGAQADPLPNAPRGTVALRVPERTYGGVRTHRVQPGESLWSVTAVRLSATGSTADVARAWPRLYRLNRDRIGADPDLVAPGTRLRLPPRTIHPHRGAIS